MNHSVIQDIPGRLRVALVLPKFPPVDHCLVEAQFRDLAGVERASFSPRTATLLVCYDRKKATRSAILERVAAAPIPSSRGPKPPTELEQKKKTALRAGVMLLARPLIPPPIRPVLAVYGALPYLKKGLFALRRKEMNVDLLDASAIGAAVVTREFFTASVIVTLLKVGDYLEEWTRGESRRLISDMFHTGDEWAWVVREEGEVLVSLEEVVEGDTVIVRMGGLIPVDGTVLDGEALVNQSSLTGEGLPVAKRKGVTVYAGTAIEEGSLRIQATQVGDQTRAARVVKTIEAAEVAKAESQSKSEEMADRIVPYSFLLSGLTFLVTGSLSRSAAVLLVDYSCAIKLSTPLAILTSLARSARHRVLIKGGKYLEKLARADAFVLDKTGTLTEATPEVADVVSLNGFEREYVLKQAACVEEHFPHPVASAVVRRAAEEGLSHLEEHAEAEYILAHGIASRLEGKRIVVGSRHFVHEDEGVDVSAGEPYILDFAQKGHSVLYVAVGGELAGLIAIHDPLRQDAPKFVASLKESGIKKVVMLTGDNEATARTIAASIGIDDYHAQALPDRKVEVVKELQAQGYTVAMVGDGINDSPALSQADVGISMRHGADIAREACDVLLMDGTLEDILTAQAVSREAMSLVEHNFRTIVAVNSAALLLAVTGAAPPVFSATIHNMSTIVVGLRSLKPLRKAVNHGG
ncbi:heavy metal translocating P-type ATPase [Citrifermentans bremense]|uniref:heavy metal translocating P-type ATPase n=1 Tax=Citrifermentans bremense TaxID=60035 RepID=UPI0003F96848|nr:heavy metal translocating P-type ATPase [Citrifermentans bremense]